MMFSATDFTGFTDKLKKVRENQCDQWLFPFQAQEKLLSDTQIFRKHKATFLSPKFRVFGIWGRCPEDRGAQILMLPRGAQQALGKSGAGFFHPYLNNFRKLEIAIAIVKKTISIPAVPKIRRPVLTLPEPLVLTNPIDVLVENSLSPGPKPTHKKTEENKAINASPIRNCSHR